MLLLFLKERSHSIPGSKPPLMRALGAYEEYFSHHKKGVFRRKRISLASMLSWSKVCQHDVVILPVTQAKSLRVCVTGDKMLEVKIK